MKINKDVTIQNIKLWGSKPEPVKELIPLCRRLAAEGSVLLENNGVLPFAKGTKVALFGRIQETYIKSGTGSGGLVRVEKAPCILDSFRENGVFEIDEELASVYAEWVLKNPFDNGNGWATEPWSQKEMPLDEAFVKKLSSRNDVAVVIIGRIAGEDRDNQNEKGSFCLSDEEELLLKTVTESFKNIVVVMNVGNLIDLSFVDRYNISALLYIWQGGQEGANALADILSGKISPCGKMPDTQAMKIEDYPSFSNFGNKNECIYEEDIYLGYRYFETFAAERVRYPFGYGLTYTSFETDFSAKVIDEKIIVSAVVKNVGGFASREVIQVYYSSPCGNLGNPSKQLAGFKKTSVLKPNESEALEIEFPLSDMASYDDCGATGNEFCFVLEQGIYKIFAGNSVRDCKAVLEIENTKTVVTKRAEQIMPPEKEFYRLVAVLDENQNRVFEKRIAPMRKFDLDSRIKERRETEIAFSGDKGIKLFDVFEGRNTLDEFVAQMTDKDLFAIVCGEGMNSPKVTEGTGAAFGGVTDSLVALGIPVCCVSDGPSGIRIGGDYKTTSLPNGYVFASSFDEELTERIFELLGVELFAHNIDGLLGPGMNIHRHPLCGRNFEYFSEDPLLSGKIAAAQTRGIAKSGCTTTIKHFCCNNQEFGRSGCDSVVSERTLREIYLKGFEIAVKEGGATALMTAYNSVNGYLTASNYDLTETVLRKEWGYKGFVMSDWWARCNCRGEEGTVENLKAMVRAHNDVFMVCESAENKVHNLSEGLKEGYVTRADLQYCAKNLLSYILNTPTFAKYVDNGFKQINLQ